jgi:hypothetical protein
LPANSQGLTLPAVQPHQPGRCTPPSLARSGHQQLPRRGKNSHAKDDSGDGTPAACLDSISFRRPHKRQFRTLQPSRHTHANIAAIEKFVSAKIACTRAARDVWEIAVGKDGS